MLSIFSVRLTHVNNYVWPVVVSAIKYQNDSKCQAELLAVKSPGSGLDAINECINLADGMGPSPGRGTCLPASPKLGLKAGM